MMSQQELTTKEAYFQDQALLDLSDDERHFPDEGAETIGHALAHSRAMPPPTLMKQSSSFLGPTPKERKAEFEAHTKRQRTTVRQDTHKLLRSSTAPEAELTESFLVVKPQNELAITRQGANSQKLKRVSSLPELTGKNLTPFYKQIGTIPRELKSGKNVKLAHNIKLEPEYKQLLQRKVVYFYPNDDISMVRRTRIHKIIQLGAAWVTRWRDDITHIMLDDASYTYSQLLRHLNKKDFPKRIVLVIFGPYIPQCIQFGTLLDPDAQRFVVKGAPLRSEQDIVADCSESSSAPSQKSLQVKLSKRQLAAQPSQRTSSYPTEESVPSTYPVSKEPPNALSDRVEDSFTMPPSPDAMGHVKTGRYNDALSLAIQEAKALAHLPLDEDEDEDGETPTISFLNTGNGSGTDEEHIEVAPMPSKSFNIVSKASALRDKKSLKMNTFQCMDPGANSYTSRNPNARTIRILEDMCKHYDQMQDHWRTLAYRKGITTLKKQTVKIITAKQAAALPFIGQRLADKIEEIVLTNRLRKLDNTRNDPLDAVLRLFLGVYGAGLAQANKWIQTGYRTLEDLQTQAKLTDSHKVGIEHYSDFNSRIPRAEVKSHGAFVINALRKIDDKFQATIMGSYRRGAKDSGDIDMIISRPAVPFATIRTVVFDQLIPQLYRAGFLKASLATWRTTDSSGSKWHGASCLPTSAVWRRLDLLLVPEEEMGAALIYFTGNDIFNRSIRLLARKKGMRLNQKGLYKDVARGRRGEKLNEGVLVEGRDEKKIFEVLGVPWREPHERIC